ncbi:Set1/Ash2 histone methyltransferase complex subunit ASH2 [Nowakowskiella sp. JEL0407]|nr:Set1/Ash2 histone methyltransferase complex subunit ASH2 [Nowakowskiella sp. JEL0407]
MDEYTPVKSPNATEPTADVAEAVEMPQVEPNETIANHTESHTEESTTLVAVDSMQIDTDAIKDTSVTEDTLMADSELKPSTNSMDDSIPTDTPIAQVTQPPTEDVPNEVNVSISEPKQETLRSTPRVKHVNKKLLAESQSGQSQEQNLVYGQTCYCGELKESKGKPNLTCYNCGKTFHQVCIEYITKWKYETFVGDDFYLFICKKCSPDGEIVKRLSLSWNDVVHLTLYVLSSTNTPRNVSKDGIKFYHVKKDICEFIDTHWKQFWIKSRTATWQNSVAGCLSVGDRFISGNDLFEEQGLWSLETLVLPSTCTNLKRPKNPPFLVEPDGTLKEDPTVVPALKKRRTNIDSDSESTSSGPKTKRTKQQIQYEETEYDYMARRKRTKKKKIDDDPVDPATAITMYFDIDNPMEHVTISTHPTHSAPQMKIIDEGFTAYTDKGYRMAKASHGVWEGNWYCEIKINQPRTQHGNLRIGWSQISGDLQAPCGYDCFSYAYRASPGTLFHNARVPQTEDDFSAGYGAGDIAGLCIKLPSDPSKLSLLFRRLWDPMDLYEPVRVNPMKMLEGSEISFYKNGAKIGAAFRDLNIGRHDPLYFLIYCDLPFMISGKYYPAISSYMGGCATINFGPEFAYAPPEGFRPYCEVETLPTWESLVEQEQKLEQQKLSAMKSAVNGLRSEINLRDSSPYRVEDYDDDEF